MQPELEQVLSRPTEQRLREWRHRTWQAIIFGLPVLFLQWFGTSLGGPESSRWVAIFQALLAGWVTYVVAVGLMTEGVMLLLARSKLTADLIVAALATVAYLFSAISVVGVFFTGHIWYRPLVFHVIVFALGAWSAVQWWRCAPHSNRRVDF
jgi:cation transport ATPase